VSNSLFQGMFDWLTSTYLEPSLKMLKLRAAIYYLEGVKGAPHPDPDLPAGLCDYADWCESGDDPAGAASLYALGTCYQGDSRYYHRCDLSARACDNSDFALVGEAMDAAHRRDRYTSQACGIVLYGREMPPGRMSVAVVRPACGERCIGRDAA